MNRRKESSLALGLAVGCAVSIVITLLGAWAVAILINGQTLQEEAEGYGVMIVIGLSAIAGSIVSVRMTGRMAFPTGLGTGTAYLIALLGCHALFFAGGFRGFWVTTFLIMGCSLCVALIEMRQKKERGSAHKKYRNR